MTSLLLIYVAVECLIYDLFHYSYAAIKVFRWFDYIHYETCISLILLASKLYFSGGKTNALPHLKTLFSFFTWCIKEALFFIMLTTI